MYIDSDEPCLWDGSGTCANGNCYDAKGPQGIEVYSETAHFGSKPWCEQLCLIIGRPRCKKSLCCQGYFEGKAFDMISHDINRLSPKKCSQV